MEHHVHLSGSPVWGSYVTGALSLAEGIPQVNNAPVLRRSMEHRKGKGKSGKTWRTDIYLGF